MNRIEKEVILLLLFCVHLPFSLADRTEEKDGYCVIHYTEQTTVNEPYTTTEYGRKQHCRYWEDCYGYHVVQRYRLVTKDIPKTKVECCSGYDNVTVHENVHRCVPICDPPCAQGHCVGPGNCTCYKGYEHISSNKCVPLCKPNCINGICIAPGQCTCKTGYDKVNNSYCAPHCSQKCINGNCLKPEECSCHDGYLKQSNSTYYCEPHCEEKCINSTCTGPNMCSCWQGYTKSSKLWNVCNPYCDLECLHGECIGPNYCSCHEGYIMKDNSVNICIPECVNCTNGVCDTPNNCRCFENYTLVEDGHCEPYCDICNNGKCISPYVCDCFEGFEYNEDGICVPYCGSCEYGNCTKPNVCECFEGYENTSGTCFPICENGCAGGECITPNNCSCDYDRVEENFCFPLKLENNSLNWSEKMESHRFEVEFSDLHIDMSTVYIKVKCSVIKQTTNLSSNFIDSEQFSISCSSVKSRNSFKFLCIWNKINNETLSYYEQILPAIIYNETESSSLLWPKVLQMTILLPTNILADDENCFICPSSKKERFLALDGFNISFSSCQFQPIHFQSSAHWEGLSILALASLAIISIITVTFLIWNYRKRSGHDYLVHSSTNEEMEESELSLTP